MPEFQPRSSLPKPGRTAAHRATSFLASVAFHTLTHVGDSQGSGQVQPLPALANWPLPQVALYSDSPYADRAVPAPRSGIWALRETLLSSSLRSESRGLAVIRRGSQTRLTAPSACLERGGASADGHLADQDSVKERSRDPPPPAAFNGPAEESSTKFRLLKAPLGLMLCEASAFLAVPLRLPSA